MVLLRKLRSKLKKKLNKIKKLIKSKLPQLLDILKKYKNKLLKSKYMNYSLVAMIVAYIGLNLTYFHEQYLTNTVSPKVIKITMLGNTQSGGTGFFINTDKGVKLLTNAHICQSLQNGTGWAFLNGETEPRIVYAEKISTKTDLCVMDGTYNQKGLTMASSFANGDHVHVVGHPSLDPTTISHGYVVSNMTTPIPISSTPEACKGPGTQLLKESFGPFELFTCIKHFNSYLMTTQIYPGNSGSPVVNFWGNVVGVVFASDSRTWKGRMIGLEEVQEFLAD